MRLSFIASPFPPILPFYQLHVRQNKTHVSFGAIEQHCKITHSLAFIPQANYTDCATATGRRILVPTFADRGMSRGQRGGTLTAINLTFLDRSRYFLFQLAPHSSSRGWVEPVADPLIFR
jgi:hypothetical protein